MKTRTLFFLFLPLASLTAMAEEQVTLPDDTAKINYSVGYQIGSDFKYQDIEIRPEAVIQGIRDALSENESQMTPSEMKQVMVDLGKRLAEKKRELRKARLNELLEKSKAFHHENKDNPDITTTESGLQYRIIEQGRGTPPGKNDKVLVHYSGKLLDGSVFDSSINRGKPASFRVDGVIKGWTEALQLMKQGDRWQLFIPPDLAYREKGAPPRIPPHSTLIFDVELISIERSK
ncbi:MAG: FKBP-type peptidyl-prolyl cis-trans isomerase [Candidatus Thiodiazotropha sp. (ex Monitilora ramsayi)]|nr:FKBP-type peptidyl-prolyl cis-trans isomerase [Candidatus Thiodiazotropha sp. (ex Monitilora ramsayi)]